MLQSYLNYTTLWIIVTFIIGLWIEDPRYFFYTSIINMALHITQIYVTVIQLMHSRVKIKHTGYMDVALFASITAKLFVSNILSFTMYYYYMYLEDTKHFTGIIKDNAYLNFLYYSISTFFTVGFGDISPVDTSARMVSVLQIVTAFTLTSYVLGKIILHN